jgi:hypothetical protein
VDLARAVLAGEDPQTILAAGYDPNKKLYLFAFLLQNLPRPSQARPTPPGCCLPECGIFSRGGTPAVPHRPSPPPPPHLSRNGERESKVCAEKIRHRNYGESHQRKRR